MSYQNGYMSESTFGEILQQYRNKTKDPLNKSQVLSQTRFGDEIGGYDRLTIYRWEADKRHIRAEDRDLLCNIVRVLYQCNGIDSREEADILLLSGKYAPLTDEEVKKALPGLPIFSYFPPDARRSLLKRLFYPTTVREDESKLTAAIDYWLGLSVGHITFEGTLRFSIFFMLWIVAAWCWWLVLQWPYTSLLYARQALVIWTGFCITIPLVLSGITHTDNQDFLRQRSLSRISIAVRRAEGSLMGYQLGVACVLLSSLLLYYLAIWPLPRWFIVVLAGVPLLSAYTSARRLPINHYQAFKNTRGETDALRVNKGDWAILFAFGIFPGGIAALFYFYLDLFLNPIKGSLFIVGVLALNASHEIWSRRRDPNYTAPSASFWLVLIAIPLAAWSIESGWEPMMGIVLLAYFLMSALWLKQSGNRAPRFLHLFIGIIGIIIGNIIFDYNILLGRLYGVFLIIIVIVVYRRRLLVVLPFILVILMFVVAVIIRRFTTFPIQWIRIGYSLTVLGLIIFQIKYNRWILLKKLF